jgi:hypothetical protein
MSKELTNAEFELWFYASKYAQVINPKPSTKQACKDGYLFANELNQAEIDNQKKQIEELKKALNNLKKNSCMESILTKREYFAALAMQSLIIEGKDHNHNIDQQIKPMCSTAVDWADCLIDALNNSTL